MWKKTLRISESLVNVISLALLTPVTKPADTRRFEFIFHPGAPVRITQVLEGTADVAGYVRDPATGKLFKPWSGKPFQAGDDWLKDTVLVVKNFSDKQVTAIDLHLTFPQTGTGKSPDTPHGSLHDCDWSKA
jgi:hypothetical protein